jgi:hypothetical protein
VLAGCGKEEEGFFDSSETEAVDEQVTLSFYFSAPWDAHDDTEMVLQEI